MAAVREPDRPSERSRCPFYGVSRTRGNWQRTLSLFVFPRFISISIFHSLSVCDARVRPSVRERHKLSEWANLQYSQSEKQKPRLTRARRQFFRGVEIYGPISIGANIRPPQNCRVGLA